MTFKTVDKAVWEDGGLSLEDFEHVQAGEEGCPSTDTEVGEP